MPMFGIGEGIRTYKRDKAELADLAARRELMQAQTQTEMQRPEMVRRAQELDERREASIAPFRAAQAEQMRWATEQEQKQLEALRQGEPPIDTSRPPTPEEVIATATGQAAKLARLGKPAEAAQVVQRASAALKNLQNIELKKQEALDKQTKEKIAQVDAVQRIFSGVRDPQSHAQAVMAYQSLPMAEALPLPPELQTYNQGLIDGILKGSPVMKEKLLAEQNAARIKSADDARKATQEYRRLRLQQFDRKITAEEEQAKHKRKVEGGKPDKPIRGPNNAEITQTEVELKRQGIAPKDANESKAMARMIMSDALTQLHKSPGLTLEEARERAIQAARERGDVEPPKTVWGVDVPGTGGKYAPKPGTITQPLDATQLKSAADLKSGSYITGADGALKYWDGKTLKLIRPPGGAAPLPSAPSSSVGDIFDDTGDEE